MKKYFGSILIMILLFSSTIMVNAETGENNVFIEEDNTNVEYIDESDNTTKETFLVNEYVIDFPDSIGTYDVNEDDYNFNDVSTFAVNGDVYAGSYNSTIVTLWNGLLNNNVGKDYVAYRSGQYEYYIFFGEDFVCNNKRFSGTGNYYYLNTYSNGYAFNSGYDSFNIDASRGYLYTNVSSDFPSLENDRGLIYENIQTVMLIALLAFYVLRWIFIRK